MLTLLSLTSLSSLALKLTKAVDGGVDAFSM